MSMKLPPCNADAGDAPDSSANPPRKKLSDTEKFAAWCEWRKWCSVLCVLEPCSADEKREKHWCDDLEAPVRRKYYDYLMNVISSRANSLTWKWIGISLFDRADIPDEADLDEADLDEADFDETAEAKETPRKDESIKDLCNNRVEEGDEKDANHFISDSRLPFIDFFDGQMKRTKSEPDVDGLKKTYKDYVFSKVERSQDPPMKVINGMILKISSVGKGKGYIVDILKDFLLKEMSSLEDNNKKVVLHESLSNALGNSDEDDDFTLEDTIPSRPLENGPSFESAEVYQKLFPPAKNDPQKMQYQRDEKIILFAIAHGVSISNPEMNSFLGGKKEYAANRMKMLFSKLQMMISYDEGELSILKGLKKLVFEEFEQKAATGTEKEAFEYLCMLEDRDAYGKAVPRRKSKESKKGIEK